MTTPRPIRILVFAGSTRQDSFNRRLAALAARLAEAEGAQVRHLELADFPLPIFSSDLEEAEGMPEDARRLKAHFLEADALLVASPEYNSSITPLLKNVIDWCSRSETEDEPALSAYRNKVAALVSASPGGLGGLRALRHVREILSNIGVLVVPDQFALSSAGSAFDESGELKDASSRKRVQKVVESLVRTTTALVASSSNQAP